MRASRETAQAFGAFGSINRSNGICQERLSRMVAERTAYLSQDF